MYPAQGLFDELYSPDDLPDKVFARYFDINENPIDVEFLKLNPPEPFFGGMAHYVNGDLFSGDENVIALENFDPVQWINYNQGGGNINGLGFCLITALEPPETLPESFGLTDEFADTYTAIGFGAVPITVARQSLCVWSGETIVPNGSIIGTDQSYTATLYYGNEGGFDLGQPYKWSLAVGTSPFGGSSNGTKTPFQNSPIGTYVDPISLESFSVSA
jgi:hypothetical protein